MATQRTIAPLKLFSVEAFQAGWYLAVRVGPWVLPYAPLAFLVFYVGRRFGLIYPAAAVACSILVAGLFAGLRRTDVVASRWAQARWGHALPDGEDVWLSILWRTLAATFSVKLWAVSVAIAILMVVAENAFVLVIGLFVWLGVMLMAAGHGMSRVVAEQLADREPVRPAAPSRAPRVETAPEPKLRCPQCGQIEVARGPVIGWQCGACAWRGPRPSEATP